MKKEVPASKGGQCIVQCVNKRFGLVSSSFILMTDFYPVYI